LQIYPPIRLESLDKTLSSLGFVNGENLLYLVFRLRGCGATCTCHNVVLSKGLPESLTIGAARRRLTKELTQLHALINDDESFFVFADLNLDRSAMVIGIDVPKLSKSNAVFVRLVFSREYPFKGLVDFTVLNDVVAHPCMGDSLAVRYNDTLEVFLFYFKSLQLSRSNR
jgi:hypothetical protein